MKHPPITAEQLNTAYQSISNGVVLKDWMITPNLTPYEILEILPSASNKMILNIFRFDPALNITQTLILKELLGQLK